MVRTYTLVTKTAEETRAMGERLGRKLREGRRWKVEDGEEKTAGAKVICLYGELGSGKTTFAQGFAQGLGITTRLLSPTFIIVRRYPLKSPLRFLYHIDLYRLSKKEEFEGLGISEFFEDSNSFVLVEWAEKLKSLMPTKRTDIRFSTQEDGAHTIIMKDL